MVKTDGINSRIAECIETLGIKKNEFAKRLNVSAAFVSQLTSGASSPSDRTVSDICREFGVNEVWLRTGCGEMFQERARHEEVASFFGKVLKVDDENFKLKFIASMARLDERDWLAIEKIIDGLTE